MRNVPRFLALTALLATSAHAEQFDTSFNGSGRQVTTNTTADINAVAFLALPNGNLASVATFPSGGSCGGPVCIGLTYMTPAGVTISSNIYNSSPHFSTISAAAVDSSGRVVVVGTSQSGAQGRDMLVRRFQPAGGYDLGFGTNGVVTVDFNGYDDYANAVIVDRNDNVVIAGSTTLSATDTDFAVVRLRASNGSLDTSFATSGKRAIAFDLANTQWLDQANALALTYDNRILIVGLAYDAAINRFRGAVTRLTADGSLDPSLCNGGCSYSTPYPGLGSGRTTYYFGTFSSHTDIIRGIDVAIGGTYYIVGETYADNGSGRRAAIARFSEGGDYVAEHLDDGLGGNASYRAVRVANATAQRVIVAGESGPGGEFLLTQGFNSGLVPIPSYGGCLTDNSGICFTGSNAFADSGPDSVASLNLDATGRPLFAATFVGTAGATRSALRARFTNAQGPKPDTIFRNGFQ